MAKNDPMKQFAILIIALSIAYLIGFAIILKETL